VVRFLLRRVGAALVSLLLFVSLTFLLIEVFIPYDYAVNFWTGTGNAPILAAREALGLDRPAWVRFGSYLGTLARGSLGTSFSGAPVAGQIAAVLPFTLLVLAGGGVLAYLLGEWLGRFAAWHRSRLVAGTITGVTVLAATAFPPFLAFLLVRLAAPALRSARTALGFDGGAASLWEGTPVTEGHVIRLAGVGLLISLVVALIVRGWARRRGWRPASALVLPAALGGLVAGLAAAGVGRQALEVLFFRSSRFFPIGFGSPVVLVTALVLVAFGEVMFVTRTGMAAEMEEDYVATARAKGVPERLIRDRHVARNAVLPVLSRAFTGIPYVLSGLIILEGSFAVSGLSGLFFTAVQMVDTPLVLGILVVMGLVVLAARLVLDVVHVALDPRIRLRGSP
jgi:peptide/nickel transport system permease protein